MSFDFAITEILSQIEYAWDNFYNKNDIMSTVIGFMVAFIALTVLASQAKQE
jgi:hypothetical protein